MEDLIRKNKPNISASSVKTYCSLLRTLYAKDHKENASSEMDLDWFNRQDHIIELLKDKPPSNRKTVYAALIAVAKENDQYKKALMDDGKTYSDFIKTQTKTEKQSENWKTFAEVQKVYESILKKVKPLLMSKDPLSPEDFRKVQDLVLLALTSGIFISPRRSTDWTEMKVSGDIDKKTDNYIDKGFFVFNKYKTAKFYDTQRVEIPKALKTLLNKYLKLNPYEYLLTDNKGNKLTNVRLSQKLNKIFDSAISTSMLRHIYLTEQLKNVPALEKLEKMAHDMGHSLQEQIQYVKH